MDDTLNNLIKTCEWRNDAIGTPVCNAKIAPCEKIIESGKCPVLIKLFKERKKLIKDLPENQELLPMGHYGYDQKGGKE